MIRRKLDTRQRTCHTVRKDTDVVVVPDLAITPAKMRQLNAQGIAVASGNQSLAFETGHDSKSFDVPLENRRFVDVADLFQAQVTARKKLKRLKFNNSIGENVA